MTKEVAIKVDNISKTFILPHKKPNSVKSIFTGFYQKNTSGADEVQHALDDISFEIYKGEFFGIVGRNGSGKSTLLKILAGIYQPTKGSVVTHGKLVPFIELGVGFNPELTGRENVYLNGAMLGFTEKQVADMYDEIVEFAELERFMDQKLKNYSSGMQVRLAFSMATRAEAEILLVDEVLAVGDADFQRKCFEYFRSLKKNKKTVVFVSHDMNAVKEYCDRAVLIEKSKLVLEGDPNDVGTAYTRMFAEKNTDLDLSSIKKRWGSSVIKYEDPKSINVISSNDKDVSINLSAVAQGSCDEAIFGFVIKDAEGNQLLGTNSKLQKQTFKNLKVGDKYKVVWTFPNVLNTGTYTVDIAISSQDYSEVYDWWENSLAINVTRGEDNSYPIHPSISVDIKKHA